MGGWSGVKKVKDSEHSVLSKKNTSLGCVNVHIERARELMYRH